MIEPKYQKLSEKLETYITENHLTGRLPGVLRLSRELGVHHVTLMKAIRLLEGKGVLAVHGTSGTYINPPPPARQRCKVLAVVRGYYEPTDRQSLIRNLSQIARPQGYEVIGLTLERELFRQNPQVLLNFPVDGFLFTYSSLLSVQAKLLYENKIPVVSCARMEGLPWLSQVDCDHRNGYDLLLDQFLKRGHRRIGFLEYERVKDYQYYLAQVRTIFQERLGNLYDPEYMFTRCLGETLQNEYGDEAMCDIYAEMAVRHWLSLPRPPTAVITASTLYHSTIHQFQKYGLHVPEDISIMGVFHLAHHPREAASGVFYDETEMTCHGMEMLLQIVSGKKKESEIFLKGPEFLPGSTLADVSDKSTREMSMN